MQCWYARHHALSALESVACLTRPLESHYEVILMLDLAFRIEYCIFFAGREREYLLVGIASNIDWLLVHCWWGGGVS